MGTGGFLTLPLSGMAMPQTTQKGINIVAPKERFSSQIGTLVSMINWIRNTILMPVKNMTVQYLDYLVDDKANSIGAKLLNLATTERFLSDSYV